MNSEFEFFQTKNRLSFLTGQKEEDRLAFDSWRFDQAAGFGRNQHTT
jgi:hypothetical protein